MPVSPEGSSSSTEAPDIEPRSRLLAQLARQVGRHELSIVMVLSLAPTRVRRTFYVITEAPHANGLKSVLPTKRAKQTAEIVDTSCNKFTLLHFAL